MYTEKILTFSYVLKMFLNIERHFWVENVFILHESSSIGGIKYIVCTNKLLVQFLVYTYQKVVK